MLAETVRGAAHRFGARAALVDPDGRPTSYAELGLRSDAVAAGLARRGVGVGGIVALTRHDDDGRPQRDGESGEIWLRAGSVTDGYLHDAAATAAALAPGGWLRTGDLGRIEPPDSSLGPDATGCVVLTGRRSEMFIRGGYNVQPQEVEAVLGQHPRVAQVAVVPRTDPVMGEVGVAVVVPTDAARPPTLAELRAFGADRLARHKLPEDLAVVDALPLTAMQKLDRAALGFCGAAANRPTHSSS